MSKFQSEKNTHYSGLNELIDIEHYTPSYNKFIVQLFIDNINTKNNGKIVDFGSGIGTLSKIYFQLTNVEKDFQPRFKEFYNSEEKRTCNSCGHTMEVDKRFI